MRDRASECGMRRVAVLLLWLWAAAWAGCAMEALAQVPVTPISDTVYHADGTVASGTVLVSWGSFTTASGQSVPQGTTSVTVGSGGSLTVSLAPNAGAMPIGTYYTAVYHLDDGSSSREYWMVPVSSTPLKLSAVRASVLPTSIATQTVTKQYVDQAIARAVLTGAAPSDGVPYVLKAGDTMTGPLVLPGDPVTPLQVATKGYVDSDAAALRAGLGQKVSTVPPGAQVVTQPAGTQLQVNSLNGVLNAKNYLSSGADGVANAEASSDCVTGCTIRVDQTYPGTEQLSATTSKTHVDDLRGGATVEYYLNPQAVQEGGVNAHHIRSYMTTPASLYRPFGSPTALNATALTIEQNAMTGGNNFFPEGIGATPYFKSTYAATQTIGVNYAEGQHVLDIHTQDCYGVGDCLIGSQFLTSSGGHRDSADEGTHPYDIQVAEDTRVFQGTCATGCTTGSTHLAITPTAAPATQGEGRYLIDKAAGKTITAGSVVSGTNLPPHAHAVFTGTSFPVSTLFTLSTAAVPQTNDIAPGTVTMPILTTGVRSGYATNTASAPATSGVACVSDAGGGGADPQNFETALYTVVDGTHVQLVLSRPHATGATLSIGGLCGYGVEQTVDTVNGLRQVFPIIGSDTPTSIYYEGLASPELGVTGNRSAFINLQVSLTSLQRRGNVVTATTSGNLPLNVNGLTLTIAGVTDSSYNGNVAVTTSAANQFTYTQVGGDSTSTGGTASMLTGSFVMYPMAEVRSVYNASTSSVDGAMVLAPNTASWAPGDPVEQPHFFQQRISADTTVVTQYLPRDISDQKAGIFYGGVTGAGIYGWAIENSSDASLYYGNGGTRLAPSASLRTHGVWGTSLDMQAGEQTGIQVECNSHGCGRWDSAYDLFSLQSVNGNDTAHYLPQANTLVWSMHGTQYTMAPTGFTAPTINATTINTTQLNGAAVARSATVDTTNASNITSGTIDPARLPAGFGGGSNVCASNVAWSAIPTFAVTCTDAVFHMPLTGNVTAENFTGLSAGARITLIFQVGSAEGFTVAWSPSVHGGFVTSATSGSAGYTQAGKYLVQTLVVDTDGVTLLNPGAINE